MKKHLRVFLVLGPAAALACGPFFYPAPPTLEHYPERLPVKTMRELLRETNPPPADAATFKQIKEANRAIASEVGTTPADQLVPRIEALLKRNRAGDYRKRFSNCLFDLRDLLTAGNPPPEEAAKYAVWRASATEWDDGFIEAEPKPSERFSAAETEEMHKEWKDELEATAQHIMAEEAKASPALKPHWLVQAGAWQFKHANFTQAAELFDRVIATYPEHPRAESARLMLARARAEEWRLTKSEGEEEEGEGDGDKLRAAEQAFDAYLDAHPKGRFAPDVPGWRAGLARESGELNEAISLFLQQIDHTDHPEIVRRAVRELEACLKEIDADTIEEVLSDEGDDRTSAALPIEEIARRPIAALAVVYHFLDSESRRDFDELMRRTETVTDRDVLLRHLPPMLRLRRAGREILPALAAAVGEHKELYGGQGWRPRYLSILGWAASECGEHKHALRLCELAGAELEKSDDLLFLRAVALQRDRDLDGALAAFRLFREKFPESPLARETQFRLATVLRDKKEAGLALVELMRMKKADEERVNAVPREEEGNTDPNTPAPEEPIPNLHLGSELAQWIDTLLQFAPLPELQRALSVPELEEDFAEEIRTMLRRRHLAREEFTAAMRYAAPKTDEPPAEDRVKGGPFEAAPDEWQQTVANLARLTREATAAGPPSARAQKLLELAETWTAKRGYLSLISLAATDYLEGDVGSSWDTRARNARVFGLGTPAIARELEERDELRHALPHYLRAADLVPGTELAARCLFRANEAVRRIAEVSPWCSRRAFETDATSLSRRLHERLLRECPNSAEAKQSVWWSFSPPSEVRWMAGEESDFVAEATIADAFAGRRPDSKDSAGSDEDYSAFEDRLAAVGAGAGAMDPAKLLAELAAIRRDLQPAVVSADAAPLINQIDDLSAFLQQHPSLSPAARAKYFELRLSFGTPDLSDPELQPALDFVTFVALVREKGERLMSERMQEFLEQFPKSAKREAALARLAMSTVRESHGHTRVGASDWPDAPKLGGYVEMIRLDGEDYEAARVLGALEAYEREFPNGRWAADIRLWRGVASIEARDWRRAVDSLVATLDDATKRDLHLDAALNLADVFMHLLDQAEARPAIMAALRENASGQKRLRQFMYSDTLGARLRCLEGYLEEQFARP